MVATYSIPLRNLSSNSDSDSLGFLIEDFVGDQRNPMLKCWLSRDFFEDADVWPLFLYGPTGCGKSALAETLANYLSPATIPIGRPGTRWQSFAGPEFARDRQEAIETKRLTQFRNELAESPGVIFDNLLQSKVSPDVQEEIVLLIDQARQFGTPIVFTSTKPPWSLPNITQQLSSRLAAGLVIPVNPPGSPARSRILQKLADRMDCPIDPGVSDFLAGQWKTTAPGLRHEFSQLLLRRKSTKQTLTLPLAQSLFHTDGDTEHEASTEIQTILKSVGKYFGVSVRQIRGLLRRREVVHARSIAIYLMREELQLGFSKIGQHLSGRDPSTIRHAYSQLVKQAHFTIEVEAIKELIGSEFVQPTHGKTC